jgi:hypothetical protein
MCQNDSFTECSCDRLSSRDMRQGILAHANAIRNAPNIKAALRIAFSATHPPREDGHARNCAACVGHIQNHLIALELRQAEEALPKLLIANDREDYKESGSCKSCTNCGGCKAFDFMAPA